MASDSIFLIRDEGRLQRVEHQLYASEELLQNLISSYPEILAGDQIDPDQPPKWLLLKQEAAVPDSADSTGRWFIDHLLLDQFGVPTFVEVKRSTDSRIRREVIGQMLDYVANGTAYWGVGKMRQMLSEGAGSAEAGDARVAEHLSLIDEPELVAQQVEKFWQLVDLNMREGNVRLLFVADELPRELRRLIEFLNEHFSKIEVLGVELRQYVGQGVRALVPRVVGQTELIRERKERSAGGGAGSAPKTNRESFLAAVGPVAAPHVDAALKAAATSGYEVSWGTQGFSLRLKIGGKLMSVIYGYPPNSMGPYATLEAYLAYLPTEAHKGALASLFAPLPGFKRVTEKTIRCALSPDTAADANATAEAIRQAPRTLASLSP